MSFLSTLLPSVLGFASNFVLDRANSKDQKSALQQQNDFNLKQYEDWKYYNSIDQQMKRASAAGVNPYSLSLSNTLPSAYQQQNAVVDRSPSASFASSFGKAFDTYYRIKDRNLQKQQLQLNLDYKKSVLDFQKQQLRDLNSYRKQQYDLGLSRLESSERLGNRKLDLAAESNQFKKDFYTNPLYLGYWTVKGSKQKYKFAESMNPVSLEIARNKLLQARTFNRNFEDYLNAQVTNMAAQATYHQAVASKYNELYNDDIATQLAMNAAARGAATISNSKFARTWNFGMKMLNDVMDVSGKGMSLWKGKGLFVPTSQNNPYSGYNYNVSY